MPTICGLTISNIVVGEIQILLAVILFGCSFVLQRSAMIDGLLPLSYNVGRYGVSAVLMILYKICEVQWQPTKPKYEPLGEKQNAGDEEEFHSTSNVSDVVVSAQWQNRKVISNTWGAIFLWGSALGISGIGGSVGQQLGLVTVSAGKTAFISGLFVIVTPFVEWLCPGYNISIPAKAWGAAALSLIGLSLLSGCASADVCFGGAIGTGEVLVFLSMFCWVLSILASDKGSKVADVVWLSVVDFSLTTVVTLVFALVYEPQVWVYPYPMFTQNWKIILITGLIEAVAFNFANLGQEYTPPTRASLLYSMEGVATALFGYIYLRETLTMMEMIGAALILVATIISSIGDDELVDTDLTLTPDDIIVRQEIVAAVEEAERTAIFDQRKSFGSIEML